MKLAHFYRLLKQKCLTLKNVNFSKFLNYIFHWGSWWSGSSLGIPGEEQKGSSPLGSPVPWVPLSRPVLSPGPIALPPWLVWWPQTTQLSCGGWWLCGTTLGHNPQSQLPGVRLARCEFVEVALLSGCLKSCVKRILSSSLAFMKKRAEIFVTSVVDI